MCYREFVADFCFIHVYCVLLLLGLYLPLKLDKFITIKQKSV